MDITKFRPNIVLDGAEEEFEEDFWGELDVFAPSHEQRDSKQGRHIGLLKTKLVLTLNCARCNSLNVDYQTGKVGTGEAGKILKKLQSDRRVDPGSKYSPVFGRYGFIDRVAEGETGVVLSIGDEVQVSRWNKSRTTWGK